MPAKVLTGEVTPERIRAGWETSDGREPALWQQLAELGLTGITVPEEFGGLGMSELDFVLLAEQCGYVALPEPLVNSVMVAVPLLSDIGGELADTWLGKVAAGEARVLAGLADNLVVEDAHVADLLLLVADQPGVVAQALSNLRLEIGRRAGLIDKDAELARLDKEMGRLRQDIERTEKKLGNPSFVDKAPQAVVQKERDKMVQGQAALADLSAQADKIRTL